MIGKISGVPGVEASDSRNDFQKGKIVGIDSRLRNRIKKLKRRQSKHPDKEIANLEAQGWEVKDYKTDAYLM